MDTQRIPNAVAAVVGSVLGEYYYHHQTLETLFMENGAPGEPPPGNCAQKCTEWLKRAGSNPEVDALAVLGGVLRPFMDTRPIRFGTTSLDDGRARVRKVLAASGMSYQTGGTILGREAGTPVRSLKQILQGRDMVAVAKEFDRALSTVETDPASSVTAACAIVESLCKVYIEDRHLEMPSDRTVKPLWRVVQMDLGLNPADVSDADLLRVLSGLTSIVDGIGAFRTHVGSAHGRGRIGFDLKPMHARLAVHSAHSLVAFAIEAWDDREKTG